MDRALNLFVEVKALLRALRASRRRARQKFSDATIVLVYYPSPPDRVCTLILDGRALPIGPHSHDPHSGYGRSAGGKGKGYKLHGPAGVEGRVPAWRVAPMNIDEREMARRMLRDLPARAGYVLADKNYDSNRLFQAAMARGLQLVAPRRYGPDKGLGKKPHSRARLRCRDPLENTVSAFGRASCTPAGERSNVSSGRAASTPELLNGLPAWVRRRDRACRWVQAKLVLAELHRVLRTKNRAA